MRPFTCPVCVGTGMVSAGFYLNGMATSTNPETCRSCAGTGIVWSGVEPVIAPEPQIVSFGPLFAGNTTYDPSRETWSAV